MPKFIVQYLMNEIFTSSQVATLQELTDQRFDQQNKSLLLFLVVSIFSPQEFSNQRLTKLCLL